MINTSVSHFFSSYLLSSDPALLSNELELVRIVHRIKHNFVLFLWEN